MGTLAALGRGAALALAGGTGRTAAAVGVQAAVCAALALGVAAAAGPRGLVALNDVVRLAPTVLGEAGTGVEDLVLGSEAGE